MLGDFYYLKSNEIKINITTIKQTKKNLSVKVEV